MEADVVAQERQRIVERGEEAGHLLGDRREVLAGGALGGQAGDADFEHAARLEHLVAREAVQRGEKTERLAVERRRPAADERAGAVTRLDDAHRRQRAQAGAHARPADADLLRQLALGGQTIAGLQPALVDQTPDVGHHQFGSDPVGGTPGADRCIRGHTNTATFANLDRMGATIPLSRQACQSRNGQTSDQTPC